MDIASAGPGTALFHERMTVTRDTVDGYLAAIEDGNAIYASERIAPPMAVAALVMARALEAIDLPAGSVHTGQDLVFSAPVLVGTEIECSATVSQNSVRRGTRFVALDIAGEVDGLCAVSGRVSLAIPEPAAGEASESRSQGDA